MKNPETFEELKAHYSVFDTVARIHELPIARVLAITMNRMHKEIEKLEEPVEKLIEEYCVTDDKGNRVGVEYDKPAEKSGGKPTKERRDLSSGVYPYAWIDVKKGKRKEFDDKLEKLLKKPIKFAYNPIKADNREVRIVVPRAFKNGESETVSNVEITVPMMEVLEKKLPVNTLRFILDTIVEFNGEI